MAGKTKPPAIVAELGRPETPAETAARKAENSYLYKKRKTLNNLIYSLLVSLALVLVIALLVPRGTGDYPSRNVDVAALAAGQTTASGQPFAAPQMPKGWLAKQAELRYDKTELVSQWYIGYTTPSGNYAAVHQAFDAEGAIPPKRWLHTLLEEKAATGSNTFAGHEWEVYDHSKDNPDGSNVLWAFVTNYAHEQLVISGTATEAEMRQLATATVEYLDKQAASATAEEGN